ncbi:MAG: fumarylacetoacetate hydrolase family protein [Spirochaetaceae bacterium]|nr:fumarylacetoacetate hydrolase family protein [Spirochaetaceae bacterium]
MRIARFTTGEGASFGVVDGDAEQGGLTIRPIDGHPFAPFQVVGEPVPLSQVRLLSPVLPSKVVAIGRNYAEHAQEMGQEASLDEPPIVFLKPSTSVIGPGDRVQYPVGVSADVHYEGELAVVIARLCREVPRERVSDVVLGFTCANDVTARDLQQTEKQWGRAKGFDTFCPLGPWVTTDLDPADLAVTTTVNGELRQAGRTSQMLRGVDELVAHVSQAMTLLPGDVILTGTPAGVGPLVVGDEVSVAIEGIGTLTNTVVARG